MPQSGPDSLCSNPFRREMFEVVGVIVLPTDAVSQKAMVGLGQRVVVARARAPHDAVVRHYPEYLGC